jgi:hypothetical protein
MTKPQFFSHKLALWYKKCVTKLLPTPIFCLNCALWPKKANCKNKVVFEFLLLCSFAQIFCSDRHRDPYKVSYHPVWVSTFFLKTSVCANISRRRFNSCFTKVGLMCDEISWRGGNFVTHTNRIFLGPRLLLRQKSLNYNLGPEFRQPLNKKKY